MKKIIVMLMCALLCVACGSEPKEEIAVNTMEVVDEEGISFDVAKIQTTTKIKSSMQGSIYYSNDESNKVYIDMVLDVTNHTDKELECDEIFEVNAKSSNGIQAASVMFLKESDGYSNISAYESLAPLESARMHIAISVLEAEKEHKITLKVNKNTYQYEYTLNELVGQLQTMTKNQVIENEGVSKITLKDVTYTMDLMPSDTSSFYTHYPIDGDDNIYLCVNFELENLGTNDKQLEKFFAIQAVYDDTYTYNGFMVVEDEDHRGFGSSYEDIAPLTKRNAYVLIEVPKVVQEKNCKLYLFVNGAEYIYEVKN